MKIIHQYKESYLIKFYFGTIFVFYAVGSVLQNFGHFFGTRLASWRRRSPAVWPDWAIYRQLGDFLKSLAIIFLTLVAQFFGDFLLKAQNLHFYAIKIFLTSKNVKIWPIFAEKKLTQQIF